MKSLDKIKKLFLMGVADDLFPVWNPIKRFFKKKKLLNQWLFNFQNGEPIIIPESVIVDFLFCHQHLRKIAEEQGIEWSNFELVLPDNLNIIGSLVEVLSIGV